ncbi:MAG: CDP-diacylglycerol--glycerol-3-phosphate 3-phosphatidyltransferase, partial [Synechococcus sp. SB0670_bin_20]|nr:CDP-diacylglycerol--glycerol-3-phosphate 3-phosphatidyltransferase [Synechococcus sp. SB0670_bin_20]
MVIVKAQSLANGLTVLRGLVAVPLLVALQGGWGCWAWWRLVVGALPDEVDGWWAR